MPSTMQSDLICRKYREVFGASLEPAFAAWREASVAGKAAAALGYKRADGDPLFLETYLDATIEDLVSARLERRVERGAIVEIGNFAAENALAMIDLWGAAANDLGGESEIAVATLTAPLRRMFARIGIPVVAIAPARAERLDEDARREWGEYYATDPWVCAGVIADGQEAINRFLARRQRSCAA